MKSYLDILQNVLDNGEWQENRTGIKTLAVPNIHFEHDMSTGFPLLTTKKMYLRGILGELEFFLRGLTDKRWLQERNIHIWDSWCNPTQVPKKMIMLDKEDKEVWEEISGEEKLVWQKENPDLGPLGYSFGWRNFGGDYKPIPFIWSPYWDRRQNIGKLINNDTRSKHIGQIYSSNYGDFTVIKCHFNKEQSRSYYDIIFNNTGYVQHGVSSSNISKRNVKDVYFPKVHGIGCIGESAKKNNPLYSIWKNMLHRCYCKKSINYSYYGSKGVYVCNRWLNASNFIEDIQDIPGWKAKNKDWKIYSLDKDMLGEGRCYSKENCCWLLDRDQKKNTINSRVIEATHIDGKQVIFDSLSVFCNQHSLDSSNINKAIKYKNGQTTNWNFKILKYKKTPHNEGIDQLDKIIKKLKTNPNCRRHHCSAWDVKNLDKMALEPCHMGWTICHINGVLNLDFKMRSTDNFLGAPYNIASYAALLLLLCKETGMKPGKLTGKFVNCHIYENHISQAEEQLTRTPRALPDLEITNWEGIYSWKHTDIKLTNYDPQPSIKGVVAV